LPLDHRGPAISDLTFKWRHCEANIVLCAVRRYLWHTLSDRNVEARMRERGVWVDHTTVFRSVQRDAPELEQRWRPQLNATNDSYRVDEMCIRIKKYWYYLYPTVNSVGATRDFMLSATHATDAPEQCFRKVLDASHRPSTQLSRGRRLGIRRNARRRLPAGGEAVPKEHEAGDKEIADIGRHF
jgi:transposase-like protein